MKFPSPCLLAVASRAVASDLPPSKLRGAADVLATLDDDVARDLSERLRATIGFGMSIYPPEDVDPPLGRDASAFHGRDLSDYAFAQCDPVGYACGEVIARYTEAQVESIADAILSALVNAPGCSGLGSFFDSLCYGLSGMEASVAAVTKYGIEVRKICASCEGEVDVGNAAVDSDGLGYCASDAYGYNATVSGLLIIPTDAATGQTMLSGPLKSSIWSHPTIAATCGGPSRFRVDAANPGGSDLNGIVSMLMGSGGAVTIAPDNMGFEEGSDFFKGYVLRKQYQTSAMSLWLKARRIIAEETSCGTEVSDKVVVSGYSEGGYGAVAIAEALQSYGADIIKLQAGAGPYKTSSALLTGGYLDIVTGSFPTNRLFYLPMMGQTYSSTYAGVDNYGTGQDLFNDTWVANGVDKTKHEGIAAMTGLAGSGTLMPLVPLCSGATCADSLHIWNDDAVDFVSGAVAQSVVEPCKDASLLAAAAAAGRPVDAFCDAFLANDMSDYLNAVADGGIYDYELCHSPDDEVIPIENVLENAQPMSTKLYQVTGNHDGAGQLCIQRAVEFFDTTAFLNVVPERTGVNCPDPTASPTGTPTSSPTRLGVCSTDPETVCTSDETCCDAQAAAAPGGDDDGAEPFGSGPFGRGLKGTERTLRRAEYGRALKKPTPPPAPPAPTTSPTKEPCSCLFGPPPTPPTGAPPACGGKRDVCAGEDPSFCCSPYTCQPSGNTEKCL